MNEESNEAGTKLVRVSNYTYSRLKEIKAARGVSMDVIVRGLLDLDKTVVRYRLLCDCLTELSKRYPNEYQFLSAIEKLLKHVQDER